MALYQRECAQQISLPRWQAMLDAWAFGSPKDRAPSRGLLALDTSSYRWRYCIC